MPAIILQQLFKENKKRIYSAKPMMQDSRRFTRATHRQGYESNILQISPSEKKIPESSFIRFSQNTAPSTDFHRSYYNPYQTMTKITDNFLNIERKAIKQNFMDLNITNRSIESDLSNLTQVQNSRTETQLQVLEKIREKNSVILELSNLKNVDCHKLLMSANQQMKKISYKLSN